MRPAPKLDPVRCNGCSTVFDGIEAYAAHLPCPGEAGDLLTVPY